MVGNRNLNHFNEFKCIENDNDSAPSIIAVGNSIKRKYFLYIILKMMIELEVVIVELR